MAVVSILLWFVRMETRKQLPHNPWGDAHKEARRREFTSDQKGRGTPSYFLKRMAALTPPKPAEIERAIFTFFSLDSLGT
jgi:hypothetical protein